MDWMLVVTVLLGVLAFLFARDERRRSNAYQAYCSSHGYRFVETSVEGFHGLAPIFLDTSQATRWRLMSQEWRYVITGEYNSMSFTAFEYRSVETFTGSDPVIVTPTTPRDRRKQTYGVLLWEQPDARLPEFHMVSGTMRNSGSRASGCSQRSTPYVCLRRSRGVVGVTITGSLPVNVSTDRYSKAVKDILLYSPVITYRHSCDMSRQRVAWEVSRKIGASP